MKQKTLYFAMLPPDVWRKKPRLSRYRMSPEDAAAIGATIVETDSITVDVAETPEEEAELSMRRSTSSWQK